MRDDRRNERIQRLEVRDLRSVSANNHPQTTTNTQQTTTNIHNEVGKLGG
jgi:hypothetical protein